MEPLVRINRYLITCFACLFFHSLFGCTEILLKSSNQYVVGRNFDWVNKYAYVVVNPRGFHRGPAKADSRSLSWESKYATITFNLAMADKTFLKEAPLGGLNEQGLSASLLWLEESEYVKLPTKPSVTSNLWVQYLLDQAKDVKEAIQLARGIDVTLFTFNQEGIKAHLFIHDQQGNSAVLEYLDEKLVIHKIIDSPPVLTNDPYAKSIEHLKLYQHFGGDEPLPGSDSSLDRFVRIANFWKFVPTLTSLSQSIAMGFNAMGLVIEFPGSVWETTWTYVFDLTNKTCYWRDMDNQQIRYVRLADFNLSKGKAIQILFLNNSLAGDMLKHFKKISEN